ncbi:MAG: alkaline phosphatase family protein [Bacteroidia bacterium]
MKRRSFIKKSGVAAATAFVAPYILPSGRLFARTMSRKANHVVFCLFAGGVRNMESVHQNEGNLMPAMFDGVGSAIPGLDPVPASPWPVKLRSEGTFFQEMRYKEGPTGHFNGHTVAVTGVYTNTGLNLRANPDYPTIFEYYLKHNSPAVTAKNAWWVSNALGPYPALNYSNYPGYGPLYGANHIAPTSLISLATYPSIGQPKQFQFHEEEKVLGIRDFLNKNFDKSLDNSNAGNYNTPDDAAQIRSFIQSMFDKGVSGQFLNPLGVPTANANNDIFTILFAEEVIKNFQPELLVVNMTDVDACHQNFTQYCNNLRKADYAVAHLWKTIQETPGMADDTVLIVVPEHGRNLEGNTVKDIYGRFGIDHTGDNTSREIFSLILGPAGVVNKNQTIGTPSNPVGESIDIVPTIAHILGFDVHIPAGMLPGRVLTEAF